MTEFEGRRRKRHLPSSCLPLVYGNVREQGVTGTTGPPLFSASIQFFIASCGARSGLPENVRPLAQRDVFASVVNCPTVLFAQRSKAFASTNPWRMNVGDGLASLYGRWFGAVRRGCVRVPNRVTRYVRHP